MAPSTGLPYQKYPKLQRSFPSLNTTKAHQIMAIVIPPCTISATLLAHHPTGSLTTMITPPLKFFPSTPLIITIKKSTKMLHPSTPKKLTSIHHTLTPIGEAKL